MNVCIVGAGAIGGMVGVQLALAGEEVTFICRGANLEAAREQGIRLILEDGSERHACPVAATDRIADAGVQDLVILAMKAHQVSGVTGELYRLFHDDTIVLTMQNGIPWWYFLGLPGPLPGNLHRGRRSGGRDRFPGRLPPRDRLRGLPRRGNGRSGCHSPCRGESVLGGRTRRCGDTASRG